MSKLRELQQSHNQIATDLRSLNESLGDKEWTPEQRSQWDAGRSKLKALDEQIKREEELRDAEQRYIIENPSGSNDKPDGNGDAPLEVRAASAFTNFIREGRNGLTSDERKVLEEMKVRAQSVGVQEQGGYTVPKEFVARIYESMKSYGGLADICQVITTDNGREIAWPTSAGTTEEGELLGENTQAGEADEEFGSVGLGAKKLSSKIVRVSNELLQDSGINIEAFLAGKLAQRLGRGEAKYIIKGTGVAESAGKPTQPKGLEASVEADKSATSATELTFSDVNNLIHSVDPAYRNSASTRLLFNDATLALLEQMVDGQGRPLWLPGLIGGSPATFLNYQYKIDQGVANFAAGESFMFFGDFNTFILRRVNGLTLKRFDERYADYDQTGFLAFHRFDCVLEDSDAIKALKAPGTKAKSAKVTDKTE